MNEHSTPLLVSSHSKYAIFGDKNGLMIFILSIDSSNNEEINE